MMYDRAYFIMENTVKQMIGVRQEHIAVNLSLVFLTAVHIVHGEQWLELASEKLSLYLAQ